VISLISWIGQMKAIDEVGEEEKDFLEMLKNDHSQSNCG